MKVIIFGVWTLLLVSSFNYAQMMVTEGDIQNSTCNIVIHSPINSIDLGDFDMNAIQDVLSLQGDGIVMKTRDESISLKNCPEGMIEAHMSIAFNAFDASHPGLVMPSVNPYTGLLIGITTENDTGMIPLTSGSLIRTPILEKTHEGVIPIFVNAYATKMPNGKYNVGQTKSEIIFTLLAN